jgi:hypothetical protein
MFEHGVDLERLYFDVPRLRSAYPSHFLSSGIAYAFHPHRDTWYSAPMCQLNWWLPIYPIEPGNALGFFPRYFGEAVKNNSEIYNYYEWNTKYRATAARHVKSDTREQPMAQQDLDPVTMRFLPPPGGIIVFSGAQLHETVPNTTNLARYSIDFRTVHYDDVTARRGAPNLDTRCTGTTMRDYLRASDLAHLPEEAIALYDDDTAKGERATRLWTTPSPAADGRQHSDKLRAMAANHCMPRQPGSNSALLPFGRLLGTHVCLANQQLGTVLFGAVRCLRCRREGRHGRHFKKGQRANFRSGLG